MTGDPRYSLLDPTLMQALPQSPYSSGVANDPSLMSNAQGAVSRLLNPPREQTLLAAEPATGDAAYGRASTFSQTGMGEPRDDMDAMDVVKTIVGLPFGLLRAGKQGIEDTLGMPQAQRREQQDAYLMAIQSLPPEQRAMLGLPVDRTAIVDRQSGGGESGVGRPSMLGTGAQEPRKTGIMQWAQNLGRDQRAQKIAQVQAAMAAAGLSGKLSLQQAQTQAARGSAASGFANAEKTGLETNILQQYGAAKAAADVQAARGSAASGFASAGASNALAGKYGAETTGVQQANVRNEDQYWNITAPSGDLAVQQLRDKGVRDNQGFNVWERAQEGQSEKTRAEIDRIHQQTELDKARTTKTSDTASGRASSLEAKTRADTAARTAYRDTAYGTGPSGRPALGEDEAARLFDVPRREMKDSWLPFGIGDYEAQPGERGDYVIARPDKWDPAGLKSQPQSPPRANGAMADPSQRRKPVSIEEWDNEVPKLPTASEARDWIMKNYDLNTTQATAIARALAISRSGR